MRLPKFSLFLAPVVLAAAALTSQSAFGATLHVPFAFSVGGQNLPAGDYSVSPNDSRTFVTLATPDRSKTFSWILSPSSADPYDHTVKMIFDVSDSGHALRAIEYRTGTTPRLDKNLHRGEDSSVHIIRGE